MTARAFITGIGGQDGTYLAERLVAESGVESEEQLALCLVPGNAEPGQSIELPKRQFDLLVSEPVEFPLYTSSIRLTDQPGELIAVDNHNRHPVAVFRGQILVVVNVHKHQASVVPLDDRRDLARHPLARAARGPDHQLHRLHPRSFANCLRLAPSARAGVVRLHTLTPPPERAFCLMSDQRELLAQWSQSQGNLRRFLEDRALPPRQRCEGVAGLPNHGGHPPTPLGALLRDRLGRPLTDN